MDLRHRAFAMAFRGIAATRADRWAAGLARGRGVILTLHRVCAPNLDAFSPNRILDITPGFLDEVLAHLRAAQIDIVSMDEAVIRIREPEAGRFFVALTFDDGFRDVAGVALPVLRKYQAPACVYVVPGFAQGTSPLWWLDLEEAVRRLEHVDITLDGAKMSWPARTTAEKRRAYDAVYWLLRSRPEHELRACIAALAQKAGHDSLGLVSRLCLDWEEICRLAADPLITLGAHTLTHPRLARIAAAAALDEISGSKAEIEALTGLTIRHFAYPVGDAASAGLREFAMAAQAGFTSAVTTRPGHVFAGHAAHLHALPRVSLNGLHQNRAALRALLSGLPFLALNRGRKLDIA